MNLPSLHDALAAVQDLRRSLVDHQRFKGWSGPTRVISGTIAILMAVVLDRGWIPRTNLAHVLAWGGVFLSAFLLNTGALVYWFLNDKAIARNPRRLKPIFDVIPPLFVGAVFTFFLILHRQFEFLFGVWMCMFGLTNLASRYVLPSMISLVGVFYIAAGMLCFLLPGLGFLNPWAMGSVFFVGEWLGGMILYADDRRYQAIQQELRAGKPGNAGPSPSA